MHNQKSGRRRFIRNTAAVSVGMIGSGIPAYSGIYQTGQDGGEDSIPWYRRTVRWGQTNITEIDPGRYDIAWWRKHWKSTGVQGVIINAGGIVAYYPSKIPLHRQAQFLEGRDLFGDLTKAAHEEGLAVFARMDSNRAHEDFYKAHPDWFAADQEGRPYKAGEMFVTCVNGPYYNEHIPAIIKEIAELYHPEGFTDNSWSGLGRESVCYCENCKKSFREKTGLELPGKKDWNDEAWRKWIDWSYARRLEIWDINNKASKEAGGVYCIWSGMNSGSVSGQSASFRDIRSICEKAEIIMLDSQARSDSGGFQQNAFTGKLIHGLLGWDKLIPESMAMYQAGRPAFRLAAKPVQEARMWMVEGIAGGIQPWWHYVSAYHEDRRIYRTAGPLLNWHRKNEEYLVGRKPVATVGIVWSQQNYDFFGRDESELLLDLPQRGIIQALIRARIPYIPVHADHIERDSPGLSSLVLPNIGILTQKQSEAVVRFIRNGGGIFATGETSLYDERGQRQPDYSLSNYYGVQRISGEEMLTRQTVVRRASDTLHTYLRLTPELRAGVDGPVTGKEPRGGGIRHAVLKGFEETDIISFGGSLDSIRLRQGALALLSFIPEFPIYPPETAWMRTPKTEIPGLVVNVFPSGSRIAFMPADIDRQYGRYNLPDHGNLLASIIRWTAKDNLPLSVSSPGLLDCNIYSQTGRLIIHIVNLTSAGTWRQPVDEFIPVGPVKIRVKLPAEVSGKELKLLVSDLAPEIRVENSWAEFTVDSVTDHEVAVII